MLKSPEKLSKGDAVAIVATARFMDKSDIEKAASIIKKAGFKVVLGSNLDLIDNQYSGSDLERAFALQTQLDNPKVKAIFCARGGYGTVRIMEFLDWTNFNLNPKWILGFSDVTVLHSHLNQVLKVQSIHSTMPITMINNDHPDTQESNKLLFQALKNTSNEFSFESSFLINAKAFEGEVVGGNLSILYSLLGSEDCIETKGKILFIEDLDEYLYHVDRMMMALKRAGKLQHLKGILIGGMSDMNDNQIPFGKNAIQIIEEHTKGYGYPVIFDFPAGHQKQNFPIIMGKKAQITIRDFEVNFVQ